MPFPFNAKRSSCPSLENGHQTPSNLVSSYPLRKPVGLVYLGINFMEVFVTSTTLIEPK